MKDPASLEAVVYGYVQGVFFRDFTCRRASELGLSGYVRNLPSGEAVEVYAEGERKRLERLIDYLKTGPPSAKVDRVETSWSEYSGGYQGFRIRY
ncbi:MAG: acylphosphatase [Dehalococcoidia bacterium]|nr:MAG: acylphosphatase [Dehalococcoidia bacterium]